MFSPKKDKKSSWRSALFVGQVNHRRFSPKVHQFQYSLYLNFLDLDEIKALMSQTFLGKWWSPIKFHRRHYLKSDITDLKKAVWHKVSELGGKDSSGSVFILTNLSYFGFCFNPVSFYYCYDKKDQLQYVLAEINNTPWDERHCYLIDAQSAEIVGQFDKDFHISPFMPMEMKYHWSFSKPEKDIFIHMKNFDQENQQIFNATLNLKRQLFSSKALVKLALLLPLIPFKVIAGIYWNALILQLKGVPFYNKPEDLPESSPIHQTHK